MKKQLLTVFLLGAAVANAQFWTPKATGFTTASRGIDDISIVDDNVVWVKAYDGSGAGNQAIKDFSRSTDGGNTWMPGTAVLGLGTANSGLSSLSAVSATTAWLSAYPTASNNAGQGVWKTTDGGATWTKQTTASFSGASSFANFVHFWNANDGVAQGDPEGGYFEIYTTSNGGTTWTRVPSANIPAPLSASEYGYVHNLDVVGDTIWFGTSLGRLYKSTDKGMTWTVSQTPISDFGGATESGNYTFSDENKGLMNNSSGQLWNTNDGGVTWNPMIPTGVFGNNDIEYIPGTTMVVSSGGATGYGSYYSLDDGATWQIAEENTQFTTIEFLNNMTGFAGGFNTNATTGGIFKYTGTQLPVAGFNRELFSVYPNPTSGILNVSGTSVRSVLVADLAGKTVLKQNFGSVDNPSVDLGSLQSGVYVATVLNAAGEARAIKIVKQ